MRRIAVSLCLVSLLAAQQPPETPVFKASSNLVIVTVVARDRSGKPVQGLKKEDFLLFENGKPQVIGVFDFEEIAGAAAAVTAAVTPAEETAVAPKRVAPMGSVRYADRRLLVLFFDWSSLEVADQVRAKEAAEEFLKKQMTAADLVAIASFGSQLKIDQDFTDDRDTLISTVRKFQTGTMSELAASGSTEEETSDDTAFAADETEFNVFNTDRKLGALEDLAKKLSALPEKKAIVYFSSGVSRTGTENQSQLRSTINAAIRANVSFYPVDARGLSAEPPGGAASVSSGGRGTGLFTGQSQNSQRQGQLDSQETLTTLADDTGGKAFIDNNDLALGIVQAQQAIQSYYVLGYYSTDERRDGQYRRVEVKLTPQAQARVQAKLDYRNGYFSDKEFKAFNREEKEKQLEDALLLGDPVTELPVALEVNWFRMNRDRYFVPVALKIPGSTIPLKKQGSGETTQFDFIGQVKDAKSAIVGSVRDSIKIQLRDRNAGQMASRNLMYDTGFTLAPGTYTLKMLVRENQTGKMGTFESKFTIPDLVDVKNTARLSSVVWASQRAPVSDAVGLADKKLKKQQSHPLVRDQQKLLPSVTHVFRKGQTMYAYAELYDATVPETLNHPAVSAAVSVYSGKKLVFESQPVQVSALTEKRNATTSVFVEVPLKDLPAGEYTTQLTVLDQAGQKFGFSRAPLVILDR